MKRGFWCSLPCSSVTSWGNESEDLPVLSGSRGSSQLFRDSGGPSVLGDGMEHAAGLADGTRLL